jgi:hypothetical protein
LNASKEFLNLLVNDEAVYKAVQILKLSTFHKSEADTESVCSSDKSWVTRNAEIDCAKGKMK